MFFVVVFLLLFFFFFFFLFFLFFFFFFFFFFVFCCCCCCCCFLFFFFESLFVKNYTVRINFTYQLSWKSHLGATILNTKSILLRGMDTVSWEATQHCAGFLWEGDLLGKESGGSQRGLLKKKRNNLSLSTPPLGINLFLFRVEHFSEEAWFAGIQTGNHRNCLPC